MRVLTSPTPDEPPAMSPVDGSRSYANGRDDYLRMSDGSFENLLILVETCDPLGPTGRNFTYHPTEIQLRSATKGCLITLPRKLEMFIVWCCYLNRALQRSTRSKGSAYRARIRKKTVTRIFSMNRLPRPEAFSDSWWLRRTTRRIRRTRMFPQFAQFTDLSLLLLRLIVAAVFVTSGWNHVRIQKKGLKALECRRRLRCFWASRS